MDPAICLQNIKYNFAVTSKGRATYIMRKGLLAFSSWKNGGLRFVFASFEFLAG